LNFKLNLGYIIFLQTFVCITFSLLTVSNLKRVVVVSFVATGNFLTMQSKHFTKSVLFCNHVAEALQEAEVAKRRRDWAFSERDKIVRERESLRTLCDRLRKERDRAVSDLAEALSESEDIKKQKNLASKQLKELRDKMEFEKESNRSMRYQYMSNSSSFSESRDSAIDSDMPSGHYSIKVCSYPTSKESSMFAAPSLISFYFVILAS